MIFSIIVQKSCWANKLIIFLINSTAYRAFPHRVIHLPWGKHVKNEKNGNNCAIHSPFIEVYSAGKWLTSYKYSAQFWHFCMDDKTGECLNGILFRYSSLSVKLCMVNPQWKCFWMGGGGGRWDPFPVKFHSLVKSTEPLNKKSVHLSSFIF